MPQTRPRGSSFYKIDLHVHSPISEDYKDKEATAEDIVDAAIKKGLDAIAITDHNDYRFIDKVQQAAHGTELTVFPGVELSTRDGHLLAIFDPSKRGEDVRSYLISCDLTEEGKYGRTETLCKKPIEEAASIAYKNGGIAIAAHVDNEKGFLETVKVGQAKQHIFQSDVPYVPQWMKQLPYVPQWMKQLRLQSLVYN